MTRNAINLSNPPAVWDLWLEKHGERREYLLSDMDYHLAHWLMNVAWTRAKPTMLAGITSFCDDTARSIITVIVRHPYITYAREQSA